MKKFLLVCLTMFCLACSGMVVSASDVESSEDVTTEKPLATVTMPNEKVVVYNGKAILVEEAGTTETTGAISYHYYIDSECTVATTYANAGAATTGSAPVKPGIYYVVAIAAEDETYQESTSNTCMLVICPKKVTGVKASLVKKRR